MDISKELLDWVEGRPAWQKDALRRLAKKSILDDQDIDEIAIFIKMEAKLDVPTDSQRPVAICKNDLPDTAIDSMDSSLEKISNINNAMSLKPNAGIDFAPNNLTIVYGQNGSGKSGFTKIIKRAAGTRGVEKIHPNIFCEDYENAPPAEAKFSIQCRNGENIEIEWEDDGEANTKLSYVSVFDHRAASIYISESAEVIYSPYHLDLLRGLVTLCEELKPKFKKECLDKQLEIKQLILTIPDHGHARSFARDISSTSSIKEINRESRWSCETDEARLTLVQRSLTQASKEAKSLRARVERGRSLSKIITTAEKCLSQDKVVEYRNQFGAFLDAKKATEKFSEELFQPDILSGAGEGPWRSLWNAALNYSHTSAYTKEEFPYLAEGAVCVLCQQPIGKEARNRFSNFKKFVEGDIQKQADEAKEKLEVIRQRFTDLKLQLSGDQLTFLNEISSEETNLSEELKIYFSKANERKENFKLCLSTGEFSDLPEMPTSILQKLNDHIQVWENQAEHHEKALVAEERSKLKIEEKELLTRKALSESKLSLEKILVLYSSISKLEICISGLNTTTISKKRNNLQKGVLIEPFCKSLSSELNQLNVSQEITMGFMGKLGKSKQKIAFKDTSFKRPEQILSEGEHRAIALACFLAEVQQQPNKQSIIIDDPVSSLDHLRRRLVAKRIVSLAEKNQVIVFTHDLVFYVELLNEATIK